MNKTELRDYSLCTILNRLKEEKLGAMDCHGGCIYQDLATGKTCLVGALLAPQHQISMHALDLNADTGIEALFTHLGVSPEDLTGFTLLQLETLQNWHDTWARGDITTGQLKVVLENLYEKRITKLAVPQLMINGMSGSILPDSYVNFA